MEPILTVPPQPGAGLGAAADRGATWLKVGAKDARAGNPWDSAHDLVGRGGAFAAAGGPEIMAVEPDVVQGWDYRDGAGERGMAASAAPVCTFDDQDGGGVARPPGGVAWNAGNAFSQFAAARAKVGAKQAQDRDRASRHRLRSGGTDAAGGLVAGLQRNFVDGAGPNDATDQRPAGALTSNRGHGTGTLSSLLPATSSTALAGMAGFRRFVGGAPEAKVIPVRIADWVVRFTTSTMVQGFDYARAKGAHVLSMSMGGLSSRRSSTRSTSPTTTASSWSTAAGNNFAGIPIAEERSCFPRATARPRGLRRDGRRPRLCRLCFRHHAGQLRPGQQDGDGARRLYAQRALGGDRLRQGRRHGRRRHIGGDAADRRGRRALAGRALGAVKDYPQPWMRIEAVRRALFTAAAKSTAGMDAAETCEKIGQGVVKAEPPWR